MTPALSKRRSVDAAWQCSVDVFQPQVEHPPQYDGASVGYVQVSFMDDMQDQRRHSPASTAGPDSRPVRHTALSCLLVSECGPPILHCPASPESALHHCTAAGAVNCRSEICRSLKERILPLPQQAATSAHAVQYYINSSRRWDSTSGQIPHAQASPVPAGEEVADLTCQPGGCRRSSGLRPAGAPE